jgi:hypothetical protein
MKRISTYKVSFIKVSLELLNHKAEGFTAEYQEFPYKSMATSPSIRLTLILNIILDRIWQNALSHWFM